MVFYGQPICVNFSRWYLNPFRRQEKKSKKKNGVETLEVKQVSRESLLDQRVKKKSDRYVFPG